MIQNLAAVPAAAGQVTKATAIPKLGREETAHLAREELKRFLDLIEALQPADWTRPTACTLWTVKDIVAHQAAHVQAGTRFTEFLNQFNPLNFRDYSAKGMNILDAANQRQVDMRAANTPDELIAEIRNNSERSLEGRQHFPRLIRLIPTPVPGHDESISIGGLIDIIFTRDMWMHRLDICRAAGHDMVLTPEHDGRINALIVRELGRSLTRKLHDRAVIYRLTGPAGGEWLLGDGASATAVITMDALDFNWLASKHISGQQALEQGLVKMAGDQVLGEVAVNNTAVLY